MHTAIIIIDMQQFFLDKFLKNIQNELIANQIKIIDKYHKLNTPIILVEYKAGGINRGPTVSALKSKINKDLSGVIIKESNSSFTKTELNKLLQSLKINNLILMGINANACVQDTAKAAKHRGYKVFTSSGIIASASRGDFTFSKNNENWYKKNTVFDQLP